jgi:CBS domain-containing protein
VACRACTLFLKTADQREKAMLVNQILKLKGSAEVATIPPTAPLHEAVGQLANRRFGALVVSEGEGVVAGILSERDIVRGLGTVGPAALDQPVSELMTSRVETCTPTDSTDSLMSRMTEGRFRHMPVVEHGRMVGLLSIGDVVKARMFEIEEENRAMASMLHG